MKKSIHIVIFLIFPLLTSAQTNILEQLGESQIGYQYWIEKGDYYYFFSKQMRGPANPSTNYRASQYILNKYDKNTFQRLAWKVVAGDTLHNDSVVANQPALFMQGDKFYIQYTKYWKQGQYIKNGEYYKQLKEDFTTVVDDKRYGEDNEIIYTITSCSSPMENGNFFVGYKTNDTFNSGTSGYVVLDTAGNVIMSGQPGVLNPYGPTAKTFRGFVPLRNDKYLASGSTFAGSTQTDALPPYLGWCIVDGAMNVLDAFEYKKGLVQSDTPVFIGVTPASIMLPTGSIITVNSSWVVQVQQERVGYPLITKNTAATRYGVDKYLAFGPIDDMDMSDGGFHAYRQLAYNSNDNKLYFGFVTHKSVWGLMCDINADRSYLEVICTDTNLNVNWRKFIRMEGICSDLGTLTVPDSGNGIFVSGFSYIDYNVDTFKMWVYHIDDNTPSADPLAIATIEANDKNISIYPNPTSDILQIVSETNLLREVKLYDISGRLLLTKTIDRERSEIDLGSFKKGVYLLKCLDKNGSMYVKKVMKE